LAANLQRLLRLLFTRRAASVWHGLLVGRARLLCAGGGPEARRPSISPSEYEIDASPMTNPYEPPSTEPLAVRPTRTRYLVVAIAVLLAVVTYLDRACISVLKSDIAGDLRLTDKQMGWVFSAFALAYALFEIPTAWWADRSGTRNTSWAGCADWMATGRWRGCIRISVAAAP